MVLKGIIYLDYNSKVGTNWMSMKFGFVKIFTFDLKEIIHFEGTFFFCIIFIKKIYKKN